MVDDATEKCKAAPPPQTVVLLGEVGELEVEREGAEHVSLAFERQRGDGGRKPLVRDLAAGTARERSDALDVVEQPRAALLDEDATENVSKEADVAPERCVGAVAAPSLSADPMQQRPAGEPGASGCGARARPARSARPPPARAAPVGAARPSSSARSSPARTSLRGCPRAPCACSRGRARRSPAAAGQVAVLSRVRDREAHPERPPS